MNGGEKILNRIKSDCDENIKTIELEAQAECDKIIKNANKQIEENNKENSSKVLSKIAQINAGTKSKVELGIRNAILKKRREEIDATVNAIYDTLLSFDDNAYFEALYKLAATLKGSEGVVYLNEKDIKRAPSDFEAQLKNAGLNAVLSKDTVDIDGGFILKNGDIEENMSFSAIISARRDEIEDLINRELFIG
ncbi:MAG: V-type ATP synthase subunit E [Ruminococcus sp.]|nr:V-type ATP synthase subunit E [Ruminococcus sp.]